MKPQKKRDVRARLHAIGSVVNIASPENQIRTCFDNRFVRQSERGARPRRRPKQANPERFIEADQRSRLSSRPHAAQIGISKTRSKTKIDIMNNL
jgi:hypothetical protein